MFLYFCIIVKDKKEQNMLSLSLEDKTVAPNTY